MAEVPPMKRQRTNTTGDATKISASAAPLGGSPSTWLYVMNGLPKGTISDILSTAAAAHRDVQSAILTAHEPVINFDYLSKKTWQILNKTYGRLSTSRQYEMAQEATDAIRDCITEIDKSTTAHVCYRTKMLALHTLGTIGALSDGKALAFKARDLTARATWAEVDEEEEEVKEEVKGDERSDERIDERIDESNDEENNRGWY